VLDELQSVNAFLPSSLPEDLLACHVPFDDFVAGARVEVDLTERIERGRAVALIGASGSGKSGVTAYVLDRVTTSFAPIRVPVFYETEETVRNPGAFARYLLQRLAREALKVEAIDEHQRAKLLQEASQRLVTPSRTIGTHVGGGVEVPWLLKGEAARDVATTIAGADLEGSTQDAIDAVDEAIASIRSQGLVPVIVLDDTDRWLQIGDIDRTELVGAFFGSIVRMLAERGCGLVVAVHDSYPAMREYREGVAGFLTETITLPAVPSADGLTQILQHRIEIQVEGGAATDAFESEALAALFSYYESASSRNLRKVLQVAHEALATAVVAGSDRIGSSLIDASAAAYLS
jgi:hypothetical protein